MNTRFGMLLGLMAFGLLCAVGTVAADTIPAAPGAQLADTIQPYNGPIGADNSLYGLKLAFENLDDSFTFNQSERLDKEINYTDLRLAELESALAANRTGAADRALDQYWQNLNQTEGTFERFNGTGSNETGFNWTGLNETGFASESNSTGSWQGHDDTGLMRAQEMIARHQVVLENLLNAHPDYQKMAAVYNYNRQLEQKFEQKTEVRFDRVQDAENRVFFHAEHIGSGSPAPTRNGNIPPYMDERYGSIGNRSDQGREDQSWQNQHQPAVQVQPGHDKPSLNYQETRDGSGTGGWSSFGNTTRNDNGNGGRDGGNRDSRSRTYG